MGAIHSRPRRDKRPGMRSIPRGTRRINSKSSGLRGAVHSKTPRDNEQVTPQGTGWAGPWAGTATTPSSTMTPGTSRYWSFISLCTLHMPIHIKINCVINAFFSVFTYLNLFACLCWLAPTLLAKLPVKFLHLRKNLCWLAPTSFNLTWKMQRRHLKAFKLCHLHLFYSN